MNEKQVINKLLTGLFHRPYSTELTTQQVEALAKKHGVNVLVTAYSAEGSKIKCLFEVKP